MVKLRQLQNGFAFDSEDELEQFVWDNLEAVFGFTPLTRQYHVKRRAIDILAATADQELVLFELKNVQDSNIVQQLSRYYHAILQERPFSNVIDYSKPARLIGIAPSFCDDNLVDISYNLLSIDFYKFRIISDESEVIWQLKPLNDIRLWELPISYDPGQNLPTPPRKLIAFLSQNYSETLVNRILRLRANILSFNEKIYEASLQNNFRYGCSKGLKSCAELRINSRNQKLVLFLTLPNPFLGFNCRMMIHTQDWEEADQVCYCPRGFQVNKFEEPDEQDPSLFVKALGLDVKDPRDASRLDLLTDIALKCHLNHSDLISKIPPTNRLEGTNDLLKFQFA